MAEDPSERLPFFRAIGYRLAMAITEQACSGFQLCPMLQPKLRCIRIGRYNAGHGEAFTELFHEHVPEYRTSEYSSVEILRALVVAHAKMEASEIVRCYLNKRGHKREASDLVRIHVEYPEPGVIRKGCGGDVLGWIDRVCNPSRFRKSDGVQAVFR
jgi:hypothetical protein